MQTFVFFFVPETKGVPIEEMDLVWNKHWWWKRYVPLPGTINRGAGGGVPMTDMKASKLENGHGVNGIANGRGINGATNGQVA